MNRFHLLPIVAIAVGALFVLKSIGFILSEDYPVGPISAAAAQSSEPESDGDKADKKDKDAGSEKPEMTDAERIAKALRPPKLEDDSGDLTVEEVAKQNSEKLLLQRLGERRAALDRRATDLDLREQLLNATELRLERRVTELKSIESRIKVAEKERDEKEASRLNGLVQMYENMKPKDAARVFDRLSLDVLVEVVRQIKPRKMSAILAKMSPETAERLTVAIATDRTTVVETAPASSELPKIEGKPTN